MKEEKRTGDKMKLTWKNQSKNKSNKRALSSICLYPNLPFDHNDDHSTSSNSEDRLRAHDATDVKIELAEKDRALETLVSYDDGTAKIAEVFEAQGNKLAEDGRFFEALAKWEAVLTLMPERAVLHEQKAQVLLEIGEPWKALKAATRATELEPSWAEAWITLGRAQLNYGEPGSSIESFDNALAIKSDSVEAQDDRQTALHLVKKRKHLQSSGLSTAETRFVVGNQTGSQ